MLRLVILGLLIAQDGADDVKKENERLKLEVKKLEEELLNKSLFIKKLEGIIKQLEKKISELLSDIEKKPTIEPTNTGDYMTLVGPDKPIKGVVVTVNTTFKFAILDCGETAGVKVGYVFDIFDDDTLARKVATGQVEKVLSKDTCRLDITEGDVTNVLSGQVAIARRQLNLPTNKDKILMISGIIQTPSNNKYILNAGIKDKIEKASKYYIVRDKKIIATLEVVIVEQEYSIMEVVAKEPGYSINKGDRAIQARATTGTGIVGKILQVSSRNGIFISAGVKDGAAPGQLYEVRRHGRKVGDIVVMSAYIDYSVCKPDKDSKYDDYAVDDFVESAK